MLFIQDARVWIADEELVWRGVVLLEDYNGQKRLQVLDEDGQVNGWFFSLISQVS